MRTDARLVHEILDAAASRHPARTAITDQDGQWTYTQLRRNSFTTAAFLARNGVPAGGRVVGLLPPGRRAVGLLYGTVRLGATFIPVSDRISDYQLRWLLADAEPSLVVVEAGKGGEIRNLSQAPVIELDDVPEAGDVISPAIEPSATALMLYTSGSTARPKAVVCPHAAVTFAAEAINARLRYRSDDVVYGCLPLSFDYGLYQVFLCALAGAELVLGDDLPDGALLRRIRAARATVLPAVPTLAELLVWLARRDSAPVGLRLITNTGAALTGTHCADLQAVLPGARVVSMYGTTECKRITIAEPDEHLTAPGTVGLPLPGTKVLIVDDAGAALPPGRTGQIVAAGPHVMAGYWHAPEQTAQRFRPLPGTGEPALLTGDFGWMDEAGRLYISGRRDDLFKRRGVRTSVQEIEAAIMDVPGVRAAAVAPPDADGRLTAWAVSELTAREILLGVQERLGRAKVPDRCLLVRELPRTVNGKVDKAALRSVESDVDGA